jgi:hypothetical protein
LHLSKYSREGVGEGRQPSPGNGSTVAYFCNSVQIAFW